MCSFTLGIQLTLIFLCSKYRMNYGYFSTYALASVSLNLLHLYFVCAVYPAFTMPVRCLLYIYYAYGLFTLYWLRMCTFITPVRCLLYVNLLRLFVVYPIFITHVRCLPYIFYACALFFLDLTAEMQSILLNESYNNIKINEIKYSCMKFIMYIMYNYIYIYL